MLEMPTQLSKKLILNLEKHPQVIDDLDIVNIAQGLLYDVLEKTYHINPEWSTFSRYGQYETPDEMVKMQIASVQKDEDQDGGLLWAVRLRARDTQNKRRNWVIAIGIRQESNSTATLYYAENYYDHLAGSFAASKPPYITADHIADAFLQCGQLRCMCGGFSLPPTAVALTHASLPGFFSILNDERRAVPVALIVCPDLVNPENLHAIAKGNLVVYACTDASVLTRMNALLPVEMRVEWDSFRVFLPFAAAGQFNPSFSGEDIAQLGEESFISGIYQAFCASLRSDDRRSFVTVDDILRIRDGRGQAALRLRMTEIEAKVQALSAASDKLTAENQALRHENEALKTSAEKTDSGEYEELLNEALAESDALKKGISALSTRLYSDMGKSFKPDVSEPNAQLQELSNAISACLACAVSRRS